MYQRCHLKIFIGYYCQEGTVDPAPCPPGTYNPDSRADDESWCRLCSTGSYCPDRNMTVDGYPCDEGKLKLSSYSSKVL